MSGTPTRDRHASATGAATALERRSSDKGEAPDPGERFWVGGGGGGSGASGVLPEEGPERETGRAGSSGADADWVGAATALGRLKRTTTRQQASARIGRRERAGALRWA